MTKEIGEIEARELAARFLAESYGGAGIEIVPTIVREIDIGWLVAYQSKEYLDTADKNFALLGNGPLVVDRAGQIHTTGTSLPTNDYVEEIRNKLKK